MPHAPLSSLPAVDEKTGEITAVIETPKGSPNKYDFDPACGVFRLMGVLPEGSAFPYDFGFIPSTLGEDGDPLDVLVFMDAPVPVGCVLAVRLLGAIEARQREADAEWSRNDRLLAAATHAHTQAHIKRLGDLRPGLLDEIEGFFGHYNAMKGKEFDPIGRADPEAARKLVEAGVTAFRRKQRG